MEKVIFIYQPTTFYGRWLEGQIEVQKHPREIKHLWKPSSFVKKGLRTLFRQTYEKSNPKSKEYCLKIAKELASEKLKTTHISFLSDDQINKQELRKASQSPATLILLYPDAIGQGWENIEKILSSRKDVHVLNGRKRFFLLTPKTLKKLKLRRRLEKYFIFELAFSIIFPFVTVGVVCLDTVKRGLGLREANVKSNINLNLDRSEVPPSKIAEFWARRPMTYAPEHGTTHYVDQDGTTVDLQRGEKSFFEKVDSTFFSWNTPLHISKTGTFIPFAKLFNYAKFAKKNVLEIGCGMGTMASCWAKNGAKITAVDLNTTAIEQTTQRFKTFGLDGEILQADARHLPFQDNSFDFVYSWGVLHHSPDIKKSIKEVHRVLKAESRFGMMLYNRKSFEYYYIVKYLEGFLHYENQFLNELELASRYGDDASHEGNPYTWPVTKEEIVKDLMVPFKNIKIKNLGTELEAIFRFLCFPYHKFIPKFVRKSFAREWGWSIWVEAEK